ncbi:MAG: VanZ family protein [Lachnospiraceae bacterium]|nr:VanZ family protein [Lachnospiraceae bacterium]
MDFVELWRIYWPNWTPATILLGVVLVGAICFPQLLGLLQGKVKAFPFFATVLLWTWLYWVVASCVLCRSTYEDYHYELQLFWSYRFMKAYPHSYMLQEILMNLVMLLPIGVLFPVAYEYFRLWAVLLFGFLCSAGIELMQLIFRKGLFEWDDMLHNTLGVVAGYLLIWMASAIVRKAQENRMKKSYKTA